MAKPNLEKTSKFSVFSLMEDSSISIKNNEGTEDLSCRVRLEKTARTAVFSLSNKASSLNCQSRPTRSETDNDCEFATNSLGSSRNTVPYLESVSPEGTIPGTDPAPAPAPAPTPAPVSDVVESSSSISGTDPAPVSDVVESSSSISATDPAPVSDVVESSSSISATDPALISSSSYDQTILNASVTESKECDSPMDVRESCLLNLRLALESIGFSDDDLVMMAASLENKTARQKEVEEKSEEKVEKVKEIVGEGKGKDKETGGKEKDGKEKDGKGKDGKEKDGKEKDGKEKDGKEKGGKEKDGKGKDGKEKDGKEKKKKKEKGPLRLVSLAYTINGVSNIDAYTCTFDIDMKLFLWWTDDKVKGMPTGANVDYEETKGLFEPDIVVTNDFNLETVSTVTKVLDGDIGRVKRTVTYKGPVFLQSMELRSFPFDCQNVQICFKPYKLSKDEVILVPASPDECACNHTVIHEWDLLGHFIKTFETDPCTSSTGKVYSTAFVTILTKRRPGWFIANVFIPMAMFLVLSWLVFFYGDENFSEKNDVLMNIFLASFSNKFVVSGQIPRVDYLTILDIYVYFCFFSQLAAMFSSALVCSFFEYPVVGPWLNTALILFQLVSAVLFHEWIYVHMKNHYIDITQWVAAANRENEKNAEYALQGFITDAPTQPFSGPGSGKLKSWVKQLWNRYTNKHEDDKVDASHFTTFGASSVIGASLNHQKVKAQLESEIQEKKQEAMVQEMLYSSAHAKLKKASSSRGLSVEDEANRLAELEEMCARMIQSLWRARKARVKVSLINQQRDDEILHYFAVKIQQAFRRRRVRKRIAERKKRGKMGELGAVHGRESCGDMFGLDGVLPHSPSHHHTHTHTHTSFEHPVGAIELGELSLPPLFSPSLAADFMKNSH